MVDKENIDDGYYWEVDEQRPIRVEGDRYYIMETSMPGGVEYLGEVQPLYVIEEEGTATPVNNIGDE